MIPVLFDYDEKKFTTQGLGALTDATSCIVTEELNGIYELEMNYPITGIHYEELEINRLILAIPSVGTQSQPFVIYEISKPINGIVTVSAEHISYRLSYIPVAPFACTGCALALQKLKENSVEENPFTVWTDITNTTRKFSFDNPQSFRLCLGGIEGSLVDTFYGEYEFDRYAVKFWSKRGTVRDTAQIIYGKNLTDLTQDESIEDVVTGIYPYWKAETTNGDTTTTTVVTLPEKVIQSTYADSYPFRRTVPYDFSQDFQEQPTEAQLRSRAKEYVQQSLTTTPTVSMSISFVSLADSEENKGIVDETLNLGDTVSVYFSKLGIATKARITTTVYDVLKEQYDSLTIGSKSSLSKTISNMEKKNKEIETNQITISQVKESLSEQKILMDGGNGGSVITRYSNGVPTELIFADTDDITTAKNLIRINKNGIAFSNNGINGDYITAWTIDGRFSANFITTGQLDGNLIKAGTIMAGSLSDSVQSDIDKGVEASSKATTNAEAISVLQDEVDGVIETWFYDYAPTDDTEPTSEWTTAKEKKKHAGDLFYDSSTGYSYRYTYLEGAYQWIQLSDSDVTKALEEAQKALDTANSIEVGGTNRMRNSSAYTALTGGEWANGAIRVSGSATLTQKAVPSDCPVNVEKEVVITNTVADMQAGFCQDSFAEINKGDEYTMSVWVKGEEGLKGRIQPFWNTNDNSNTPKYFNCTGEWQYVTSTYTSKVQCDTHSIGYVYIVANSATGKTLEVTGIKIEKGNKATAWSPAPEDVDKAIDTANSTANSANTLAKSKRRIFITTPTPPYDVGDLWTQGSEGDIMTCINAEASSGSFADSDWALSSNYTDDTLAQTAKESAEQAQESADNAQTTADSATVKANTAQAKADSNATHITSLETNVSGLEKDVDSIQANLNNTTALAKQAQTNINSIKTDITRIEAKADTASSLAQRITLNADGIKISATNDGKSYVLIQNDGMRVYVNGTMVAEYLAERANVNNIYYNEGKMGNHIIDKFTMNSVKGTAFFYNGG